MSGGRTTFALHFDPDHGWTTVDGVPLAAWEAERLGLDSTLCSMVVRTPAGPVEVPEDGELHFAFSWTWFDWAAVFVRRPCAGGCGRQLDIPLDADQPERRCPACGPASA
jgi:hypothetical protein